MIKAIVVDDDLSVHKQLERLIVKHCPYVAIVGNATGVAEGITIINKTNPDLIFLDVRLGDGSGFDLIDQYYKPDFKVILISGFNEYALKGYKFNAIDYILKPVREEELVAAVNKAAEFIRNESKLKIKSSEEELEMMRNHHKMILKTIDQIYVINTDDIMHIEADRNYSTLYIEDGKKLVVSRSIKEFGDVLSERGFYRIHKSHIININKVSFFNKPEGGTVVLKDGSIVPVASRKREFLINLFNTME